MAVMTPSLIPADASTTTTTAGRGGGLAAALVGLALAASYAPNLADLAATWRGEPNYTYGFLIIPIALAIAWQRRRELKPAKLAPSTVGWLALVAVLVARTVLYERAEEWAENATLLPAAAALILALGGWHLLRWAAAPLAVLVLMLPLPNALNSLMAGPLQTLAAIGSEKVLQVMGLPVLRQGNTLRVVTVPLEVARACNGLSMLLTFVTLMVATVLTVDRERPMPERIALLLSAIPIALVANIIRIVATAWAYHLFGPTFGEKVAHNTAGFAMMPIGLALVWLELRAFDWLIVEDRSPTGPARLYIPVTETGPRVVKK
jgi:exosortase